MYIKVYPPATADQIKQTESVLGLRLFEIDVGWLEFLKYSNGASILDYCLLGAMTTNIASITEIYNDFSSQKIYQWHKEHFISFLVSSQAMDIGFVRKGTWKRCVAFMSNSDDNTVLPIASTFDTFMDSFLTDVKKTLLSWKSFQTEDLPYSISDNWPLDLESWCKNDFYLKEMLFRGELSDLFRNNYEYSAIVDSVIM